MINIDSTKYGKRYNLGEKEVYNLLHNFNDTAVDYPQKSTLLDLFYKQVEVNPQKVALLFKEKSYTYNDLNTQSNQLASYLCENYSIKADDLICIKLHRSLEMIISILAVLKSGGAYIPVDPDYPQARIDYIQKDSGCKLLLDEAEITKFNNNIDSYSTENRVPNITSSNLAYVIYTSGSTGNPKGCMLEHSGVVNRIEWMWKRYNFTQEDVILQKTTFTFDVSVWELFMPLCWGVKMVLCEKEDIYSPDRIINLIAKHKVSCLHFVPSMLNAFIKIGFSNPNLKSDLVSLKRVITSGEALSLETVKRWYKRLDISIQNLYGPTEASVDVTSYETSKGDKIIPIGKPIDNTQIYILDDQKELLPLGEVGELYLAGAGLARGYLNRADLTAKMFIANPFNPGKLMYKTGDLGRFLPDGNIEYIGRKDHQVKIRGFRIELDEIENALLKHDLIDEVVVLAKEDSKGDKELVMYYIPDKDKAYTINKIVQNGNKGVPDRVEIQDLPNGMSLYTYNKSELKFLYEEIFTDKIYFQHGITIPDNGCVVDIGANLGMFTVCANMVAKDVKIYSFEPLPPTFELLNLNSSLYKNKTKVFNCGISSKEESVTFTYYPNATILSSRYTDNSDVTETVRQFIHSSEEYDNNKITDEDIQHILEDRLVTQDFECKLKTLSQIIREEGIEQIDLLKIDVEGSEIDVIEGIDDSDWKKIKQVVLEVHDSNNRLDFVMGLLKKHNFIVHVEQSSIVNKTKLYDIYAISSTREDINAIQEDVSQLDFPDRYSLNRLRENIKGFAKELLPEYMIPAHFVELEEMPITKNGKLDRKALLALESSSVIEHEYIAPVTSIEEKFASIWGIILEREKIGTKDNFFELGGHSLKAAQTVNLINREGYELSLSEFMSSPTIEKLAEIVSEKEMKKSVTVIKKVPRDREFYPISQTQEELWFLDRLDDTHRSHNILMRYDFPKSTDTNILTKALNIVLEHYEAFHSTFPAVDGIPVQKLNPFAEVKLDIKRVKSLEEFNVITDVLKSYEIDITKGRLYKFEAIDLKGDLILLMNIHHIIFDGWSLDIFMKSLTAVYDALKNGRAITLNDDIQNIDFALYQKSSAMDYSKQLDYWRENLTPSAPVLSLPTKSARPKLLTTVGKREWFKVDQKLKFQLNKVAKSNSVTLFSLILTVYKLLLAKNSGENDIVVGTPFANRKNIQEEGLIGYYTNMVAIRSQIKASSFSQLLKKIHENCMQAISNSDVSFGEVLHTLNIAKDSSITPIYQASFIMQNWVDVADSKSDFNFNQKELGVNTSKTDITLNAEELDDGIEFWIEYNSDLFERDYILELKQQFIDILKSREVEEVSEVGRSCYIITETSLGIRCAQELLDSGFHIYGIISPNRQVQEWAKERGIFTAELNRRELLKLLSRFSYEYLFSIVNEMILTEKIIDTASKDVINFHDSMLPEYRGMYSTFWAINNEEKTHGVSWHHVDKLIDKGDILIQEKVDISKDETSNSLNIKCYEAAFNSFKKVVHAIERGILKGSEQDKTRGSYNNISKRNLSCYALDVQETAGNTERFIRSLNFGDNENPVASLKIIINGTLYIIDECSVKITSQEVKPGTIVEKSKSKIVIALNGGLLEITKLLTIGGEVVSNNLINSFNKVSSPTSNDLNKLMKVIKDEGYWITRFRFFEPLEVPKSSYENVSENRFLQLHNEDLPYYLCFLARLSAKTSFDVVLNIDDNSGLTDSKIPFRVNVDLMESITTNVIKLTKRLDRVKRKSGYLKDIFYRIPQISACRELINSFSIPEYSQLFSIFKKRCSISSKISEISLISQVEEESITRWNNHQIAVPQEESYCSLFEKQAVKNPNNVAVEFAGKKLTYKELNDSSEKLAQYILSVAGDGGIIGLCLERSLEMVVIMLAIMKSGNAYLPLDPKYPISRLEYMLKDSNCEVVFVSPGVKIPKVKLQLLSSDIADYCSADVTLNRDLSIESRAYLIYTSGSTGAPKGVAVSHKNLVNHNIVVGKGYSLNAQSRVMQFASISFDISVEEIFPTWLVGGTLVLRSEESSRSPKEFFEFIEQNEISVVDLPTAFWHEIVSALPEQKVPKSLKCVIIGGEKASSEVYENWNKHVNNDINFFNTYGPTEATIIATIGSGVDDSIGRVIPNSQIYILDKFMHQTPFGIAGELYIGGAGVAKGYINKPDLTKKSFVEYEDKGLLYSTGDLASYYPDGRIKFLGRADTQVKLNGYRIELEEIEGVFNKLTHVKESLAYIKEGSNGRAHLYLYYVSNNELSSSLETLAKSKLPSYMQPYSYIKLDKIPLTINGKIDKKALPEPVKEVKVIEENVLAHNVFEMQLLPLFSGILGQDVGLEDNFFELGGDSLNAIELIVATEKIVNKKINSAMLYQYPTVRGFAAQIEKQSGGFSIIIQLQKGKEGVLPLFLMHTTPGDVLGYVNLIYSLSDDIPVYGVQSAGMNGLFHENIDDMVSCYAKEIKKIQPSGPYNVGGWCYGGILAYETAIKLYKAGDKLENIFLFDTWGRPNSRFKRVDSILRRIGHAISLGPTFWKSYFKFKLKNLRDIHDVLEDRFVENITDTLGNKSREDIERLKKIYRINLNAVFKYNMSNYDKEITLFVADTSLDGLLPDPKFGWKGIVKKVKKIEIVGSHMTLLKQPYVTEIADAITKQLLDK